MLHAEYFIQFHNSSLLCIVNCHVTSYASKLYQTVPPEQKRNLRILPFVTQYQPSVPNLKQILMGNWHVIEQQPLLSEIYRSTPLISNKRGRSLKGILLRAKPWKRLKYALKSRVGLSTPFYAAHDFSNGPTFKLLVVLPNKSQSQSLWKDIKT